MIKGIFFDIGYVLCQMNTGDWRATNKFYEHVPKDYMSQLPVETIRLAYEKSDEVLNSYPFVRSLKEEEQMHREAYQAMIHAFPDIHVTQTRICEIANDRTYNMDNYLIYEDVEEVISALQEHYKIGIISDTWPSADDVLKRAGVFSYIDSFTYSCYLGVTKPDGKMYEHALKEIGLAGEETVFIDDSVRNLDAAAEYGITPVLKRMNGEKGASPYHEVESLRQFMNFLKK